MFKHCSWSQDTKFDLGKIKRYLMVLLVPSFSFFSPRKSARGAVEILAAPPSPEEDQVINFSLLILIPCSRERGRGAKQPISLKRDGFKQALPPTVGHSCCSFQAEARKGEWLQIVGLVLVEHDCVQNNRMLL